MGERRKGKKVGGKKIFSRERRSQGGRMRGAWLIDVFKLRNVTDLRTK